MASAKPCIVFLWSASQASRLWLALAASMNTFRRSYIGDETMMEQSFLGRSS